jgi:hypothetical protein
MRASMFLIGLALCAAIATGCGEDDAEVRAAKAPTVSLAERQAQLERDPYDLRCSDLRDKVGSARMTRIVQYALADDAKIRDLSRLQASQSIFYAITELCKDKAGTFEPAEAAIEGVRSGEFRADLSSP